MSKYVPRRAHPRFVSCDRIGVVFYEGDSTQTEGELTNISAYGACIAVTAKHFEPGIRLLLRVYFPGEPDAFVSEAEIVWSRNVPFAGVAHGVRFLMMEDEQRQQLESLLARPGFRLESSPETSGRQALDDMMLELTEDLAKLGQAQTDKLGG